MRRMLSLVAAALVATAGLAHAETVRVGISADPYPPFTWKEADGTWKGFEIDLLHAICDEAKWDCPIVETAWDGIIPALTTKKIDMIVNSMTITDQRKDVIAFSAPYYAATAAFIGAEGEKTDGSPEWFKGKIIGVQVSTTHAAYAQAHYGKLAEIKSYNTQDEANADLAAGRVDVVIADQIALESWLKADAGKGFAVIGTVPFPPDQIPCVGAGMRKEDTALKATFDAALAKLLKTGKYDELAKPYFTFDVYGLPRKN